MKNADVGSSFDDWLCEEGLLKQATAAAAVRVVARLRESKDDESRAVSSELSANS